MMHPAPGPAVMSWTRIQRREAIQKLNGHYHFITDKRADTPELRAECGEIAQQIKLHEIAIQASQKGRTANKKKGGAS